MIILVHQICKRLQQQNLHEYSIICHRFRIKQRGILHLTIKFIEVIFSKNYSLKTQKEGFKIFFIVINSVRQQLKDECILQMQKQIE
ncbi:hypothetical protein pb186bvf_014714 [Paramecium bursaria]